MNILNFNEFKNSIRLLQLQICRRKQRKFSERFLPEMPLLSKIKIAGPGNN
jgi:hypothetical protein